METPDKKARNPESMKHIRCSVCGSIGQKGVSFTLSGTDVCNSCFRSPAVSPAKQDTSLIDRIQAEQKAERANPLPELTDEQKAGRCPDCGVVMEEGHVCKVRGINEPDPPSPFPVEPLEEAPAPVEPEEADVVESEEAPTEPVAPDVTTQEAPAEPEGDKAPVEPLNAGPDHVTDAAKGIIKAESLDLALILGNAADGRVGQPEVVRYLRTLER